MNNITPGYSKSLLTIFILLLLCTLTINCGWDNKNCYSRDLTVKNYQAHRSNFLKLANYVYQNNLGPLIDIEFFDNGNIGCYLTNGSPTHIVDLENYDKLKFHVISVDILANKNIEVRCTDTTLNLNNWMWEFEGGEHTLGYNSVLKYLNLTNIQIGSLRSLVSEVNCKSVEINENGDILLRFCGLPMCQVQYIISKKTDYSNMGYTAIDEYVYYGLYKSSLFCGNCFLWD